MRNMRAMIWIPGFIISMIIINTGCSTNMFRKGAGGAVVGAASASFVGGMTDLILDGKINTSTMARNATSGAIAGGMAGAAYGHQQDKQQDKQQKVAASDKTSVTENSNTDKQLKKRIGSNNFDALVDLAYKRHESAYKKTLKSVKSKNKDYQEAGYIIQALIDKDRNNAKGVEESLNKFVELNKEKGDIKEAQKGLNKLYGELLNIRKVKGI